MCPSYIQGQYQINKLLLKWLFGTLAEEKSEGEILDGDRKLADKGFDIDSDLKKLNMSLNIPPFLKEKSTVH